MTREIILTQGKVALVDDEDYEGLAKFRWRYMETSKGRQGYAKTHVVVDGDWQNRVDVYMHRMVLCAEKGQIVDHINHDKLDNRKSNLRIVTHSQNVSNKPKQANNTSGYKGVTYYKRTKRWMAQVKIEGKYKCIGYFSTPEEAAAAYDEYVIQNSDGFIPINNMEAI